MNVDFLKTWMEYVRHEQRLTLFMNVSYLPDASADFRRGRAEGLRLAESMLGMLALEQGIDLRPAVSPSAEPAVDTWPKVEGELVRVRCDGGNILSAPRASLHIVRSDSGISVWCNGTGMGQVDEVQAKGLEAILAERKGWTV